MAKAVCAPHDVRQRTAYSEHGLSINPYLRPCNSLRFAHSVRCRTAAPSHILFGVELEEHLSKLLSDRVEWIGNRQVPGCRLLVVQLAVEARLVQTQRRSEYGSLDAEEEACNDGTAALAADDDQLQ